MELKQKNVELLVQVQTIKVEFQEDQVMVHHLTDHLEEDLDNEM